MEHNGPLEEPHDPPPTAPWRVLIVDDDDDFRRLLRCVFEDDPRFAVVGTADSAGSAMASVEMHNPDLVVLDHGLPDAWGAHSTHALKSISDDLLVVIFSALPKCDDADELEVDEWIDKTQLFKLPDLLMPRLRDAWERPSSVA